MLSRLNSSVMARRLLQAGLDACLVALAFLLAFVLRFDRGIPPRYSELLGQSIAFVVVGKLVVFWGFGLYHKLWRFTEARTSRRSCARWWSRPSGSSSRSSSSPPAWRSTRRAA